MGAGALGYVFVHRPFSDDLVSVSDGCVFCLSGDVCKIVMCLVAKFESKRSAATFPL